MSSRPLLDLHVHTDLSHDGSGTIVEFCEAAIEKGMRAIGFCEHVDLDPRDMVSGQHDYELYKSEIEKARDKFGDSLSIMMGAEVGYVPRVAGEISDFLNAHQYDFVVGAVHTLFDGESGISDQYEAAETFARHEVWAVYDHYFKAVLEMVVSGLFDVVGHLDLVQRYGMGYLKDEVEWGRFYGPLRKIYEGAIKRQMAVEINTSGLRQAPKETYPCRPVLEIYSEIGGSFVTIGSDAHSPADLAAGVEEAMAMADELKLDYDWLFKNRIPSKP